MKNKAVLVAAGLVWLSFQAPLTTWAAVPQAQAPEDEVRGTLKEFQKGVEKGDLSLGNELAAEGPFREGFIQFYNSLATVYSSNRMAFPMEIGHVKILKDGKAKAETYLNPGRNLFVFTLTRVRGRWRFSHMEGIRFPLYDVPPLPASSVYQLPADKVKWMICERDVALNTVVFEKLRAAIGPEKAREFFLNQAAGFRVAMDAWLPFVEGAAQFVLFYGILEENYYGSKYVITKASEDEAEIRFSPLQELEVMKIAYFQPKMSQDGYRDFYRQVMAARAKACGLDLEASFDGTDCTLKLKKIKSE